MKLLIRDTNEQMSAAAAQIVLSTMYQDKQVNLSLTTGASPTRMYEMIIPELKENRKDFRHVHYYNFDNIKTPDMPEGMMMADLRKTLLTPAEIPEENIHPLTEDNWMEQDDRIAQAGGLDLMLVGLGGDGHFCANMPISTDFTKGTHLVSCRPEYPWYADLLEMLGKNMPENIVTMGPAAIMKAKRLVLIVNGKSKAEAVKKLADSSVDSAFPASILKLHPNFTVILDKEAASLL